MPVAADILTAMPEHDLASSLEWQAVITGRHNLLLEGPKDWTEAVLWHLAPLLRAPVIWTTSHTRRRFPAGECGALVLPDVAGLNRDDQAELLEWLQPGRQQVISTTMHPLFALLSEGSFDAALYYRLNVIRLCGASSDSPYKLTSE